MCHFREGNDGLQRSAKWVGWSAVRGFEPTTFTSQHRDFISLTTALVAGLRKLAWVNWIAKSNCWLDRCELSKVHILQSSVCLTELNLNDSISEAFNTPTSVQYSRPRTNQFSVMNCRTVPPIFRESLCILFCQSSTICALCSCFNLTTIC